MQKKKKKNKKKKYNALILDVSKIFNTQCTKYILVLPLLVT